MLLKCLNCGKSYVTDRVISFCESCDSPLIYSSDYQKIRENIYFSDDPSFWRYSSLLPHIENKYRVSIGEGRTPLFKAIRLGSVFRLNNLFLKDETRNPTNSFRDRAASLLVSHALSLDFREVICASNGNLGAAISAYCAKASIKCNIVTPKKVDVGKLSQMKIYDANIISRGETIDESIRFVLKEGERRGLYPASSGLNPLILEAQKTISFEIIEQVGVPDFVVAPMGDGGTIYSLWKGFKEFYELGLSSKIPRMIGVQSTTCAPIVKAFTENSKVERFENGSTNALGIYVLEPINGTLALSIIKESNGLAVSVSDKEIIKAQKLLAVEEGIYGELASSATVSALSKMIDSKIVDSDSLVVCVITGSGLKDPYVLAALTSSSKQINLADRVNLKLQILRLISLGETYGYSLWNSLSRSVTLQAIYQHLNELEERLLINSSEKNNRKYYNITAKGLKVLNALEELALLL